MLKNCTDCPSEVPIFDENKCVACPNQTLYDKESKECIACKGGKVYNEQTKTC